MVESISPTRQKALQKRMGI